jgi:hypothetical protein
MNKKKRISLWAACLQIGGYSKLLLYLAQRHGLEIHVIGRARYVNRADLELLARYMGDWQDRPRLSRRPESQEPRTRRGRRRRSKPRAAIGERP